MPSPTAFGMVAVGAMVRLESQVERELCERAKAGDRVALGKLLRTYGPVLYRSVLLPRLGSEALAQDSLSETYARVVERFHQYEWQPCGVYPWLRVVALRIALDVLRTKKRESLFSPEDLATELEKSDHLGDSADVEILEAQDRSAARARVDSVLSTIHPRYERAIRLRLLQEMTREEVAKEMGVTLSTFDVILHRALNALRKGLQDDGSQQEVRS